MEFRIEKMDEIRVVGYVCHTTNENGVSMREVPKMWSDVVSSEKRNKLFTLSNQKIQGIIGANVYNTDAADNRKFDYYIAVASDLDVPEGMEEYYIPSRTWAVFPCGMAETTQVEVKVVTEWQVINPNYKLLNTGYETGNMKAQAPDLEVYPNNGTAEVWVAVTEK